MIRSESRIRRLTALGLPAVALLALAGAVAARAGDDAERREKVRVFWSSADAKDELVLEDLDLAPGESREVTTENGESATITRDAVGEGMTVEVGGKQIRIGGADEMGAHPGQRALLRKRVGGGGDGEAAETIVLGEGTGDELRWVEREVDGDGEAKSFVVLGGGDGAVERDVVFLRGEPGEHGFAFKSGDGPLLLPHDHLLARIEKSEKFLALDPATQEIVREVVRDAQPKMKVRRIAPGEAGEGDEVRIVVEREVEEKIEN
jgi:hypothetical protein